MNISITNACTVKRVMREHSVKRPPFDLRPLAYAPNNVKQISGLLFHMTCKLFIYQKLHKLPFSYKEIFIFEDI